MPALAPRPAAAAAFLCAALAWPAGASAGVAELTDAGKDGEAKYRFTYSDGAREQNRAVIQIDGAEVTVTDGAGARAGEGCRRSAPTTVVCSAPERVAAVVVELGRGDDRVELRGGSGSVDGGTGDDVITGGPRSDRLAGGPGNDRVDGGPGHDVLLEGRSANGRDRLLGGRGTDTVSYARRSADVQLDLEGDRDDGEAGERDLIGRDVEALASGRGDDTLTGDSRANDLRAGTGANVLRGNGGRDLLKATGPGSRLEGGRGADTLVAGRGDDTLVGGQGPDVMSAGRGSDRVWSRDGAQDRVDCGPSPGLSPDSSLADRLDHVVACGDLSRSGGLPFAALLAAGPLAVDDEGATSAPVGCSQDVAGRCAGSVELRSGSRLLGQAGFDLAPGSEAAVALELGSPGRELAEARRRVRLLLRTRDGGGRERKRALRVRLSAAP